MTANTFPEGFAGVIFLDPLKSGIMSDEDVIGYGVQLPSNCRSTDGCPVCFRVSLERPSAEFELCSVDSCIFLPYVCVGGHRPGPLSMAGLSEYFFDSGQGDLSGEDGEDLPVKITSLHSTLQLPADKGDAIGQERGEVFMRYGE